MSATAGSDVPRVEGLLAAAHRNLELLRKHRSALERSGVDRVHLLADAAMMAFALLGDHSRESVIGELRAHWDGLQARGLAHGPLAAVPTPVLRLLTHALSHVQAIGTISEQLLAVADAPAPPADVWRGANAVSGLWGQRAQLHFTVRDADYVLIDPDRVFGLQPALLALDPDTSNAGSFPVPVDNGEVRMRLRHRDGHVFCQVVQVRVAEVT